MTEVCDCRRALIEAYGSDDQLDYYDHINEDLRPHLCVWQKLSGRPLDCDCLLADEVRCQKWFHFAASVRDIPTHLRNEYLGAYERELYPELCDVGAG